VAILAGIEHLIREGLVDAKRQFVYGISYGGDTICSLIGQTHPFRAAAQGRDREAAHRLRPCGKLWVN